MWVPNMPIVIVSTVAATAGGLCLFKDFYGGPPYDKNVKAEGKVVIVTGATSGIGREAAWDFARRGAKVFMACRNMETCEEVRRDIVLESSNKFVYCRPCDMASTESIRKFVERFKSEEPQLHVLVNNAGVMEPPASVTRDGFETQFGVNHLGHFLLTNLLLDTLKESAPSRVITVTGSVHQRGQINKDDLNFTKKYDAPAAYAQSKLANLLFVRELGRRLLGTGVSVVAVDPGLTDTNITRHMSVMKSVSRFVVYPMFWPFMKSSKIGSQVIVHAALDPALSDCSGDYYVDMKKKEPSKLAQDYELASWLWKVSEKWTKLDQHKATLAQAKAA
ncbi:retinol dehydrogenase 13-like [Spodoptera litura]|uniref:Retinol dehydrogenase 13-like n=1 Tax=Spodoptera litura TaxID=69820 RepID=A0A9J7DWZ1_SPOLT|nr:retinol dehydrogenase 13-like [Spodoptera litura]XP_022818152.1 retinol dehydrogenase 13-like [Spodoptera litura]